METCHLEAGELGKQQPKLLKLLEVVKICLRVNLVILKLGLMSRSRYLLELLKDWLQVLYQWNQIQKKKYSKEILKALGATIFEGTVDPAEAEAWLNLLEKCYRVMRCPDDRKENCQCFFVSTDL